MNDITGIVVKDLLQTKLKKYKSYTNSNCVPSFCRELQTIMLDEKLENTL